jgi:tRNA threonylcarbamoyladenosine biosynthesis protein TsaE
MSERTVANIDELEEFAREFLLTLEQGETAHPIALRGDLGAGKTALTKAFAKALGIEEEVTSPTFVIMKSYEVLSHPFFKNLSHIDAYRIEDVDEMKIVRLEELVADPSRLIVIEWPEHIKELLPKETKYIDIEISEGEKRIITYGD